MLDHLVNFNPDISADDKSAVPVEKNDPADVVSAQLQTADWLKELGAVDSDTVTTRLETEAARQAFNNIVTAKPSANTHHQLAQIKTPEAVRHLVGMLTAYDWEFVQQAKELRGYTVAKLVEETQHSNPSIRLKALGLLGKVTEVGLFTEKIEVKQTAMSEDEVERKLKEKLAKLMDVSDADVIDIDTKPADTQETADKSDKSDGAEPTANA